MLYNKDTSIHVSYHADNFIIGDGVKDYGERMLVKARNFARRSLQNIIYIGQYQA
jgi:hypothetical protein